jgi:hypothetical protein
MFDRAARSWISGYNQVGKHDPQTLPVVAQNQFLLMSNIMGTLNNAIGDIVLVSLRQMIRAPWPPLRALVDLPLLVRVGKTLYGHGPADSIVCRLRQ